MIKGQRLKVFSSVTLSSPGRQKIFVEISLIFPLHLATPLVDRITRAFQSFNTALILSAQRHWGYSPLCDPISFLSSLFRASNVRLALVSLDLHYMFKKPPSNFPSIDPYISFKYCIKIISCYLLYDS